MCNCQITKDGTHYHKQTCQQVISVIEQARLTGQRLRFHWGNTISGEDWNDCYDICGTIGKSTGPCKVPLLLNNARSTGGPAILDHCVVKITTSGKKQKTLYQHQNYHM